MVHTLSVSIMFLSVISKRVKFCKTSSISQIEFENIKLYHISILHSLICVSIMILGESIKPLSCVSVRLSHSIKCNSVAEIQSHVFPPAAVPELLHGPIHSPQTSEIQFSPIYRGGMN